MGNDKVVKSRYPPRAIGRGTQGDSGVCVRQCIRADSIENPPVLGSRFGDNCGLRDLGRTGPRQAKYIGSKNYFNFF